MLGEITMFRDADGDEICTGDVIRAPITINTELHGTWGDYLVEKAPGGYKLSYLRSEKGQKLPKGYTGGYMVDLLPDEDETDLKTLVFTLESIKVAGWQIIRDEEAAAALEDEWAARLRARDSGRQPEAEKPEALSGEAVPERPREDGASPNPPLKDQPS
jgi:hypothetical protein